MKKIRQSFVGLLTAIIFLGLVASAAAQEVATTTSIPSGSTPVVQTDPAVDPVMVARAFALKTPDHYEVWLYGTMLVSNDWQAYRFTAMMDGEFNITDLRINDVAIKLPKPIRSLPIGDGGLVRNVDLSVLAYSDTGEYVGSGSLNKPLVFAGDSLTIELRPSEIKIAIPGVDVAAYEYGGDINLRIPGLSNYGWGNEDGNFFVYMPVVSGTYDYELIQRSTGKVIGAGKITNPFKPVQVSKDAFVGLNLQGNVRQVKFDRGQGDGQAYLATSFDCQIPVGNGVSDGKVFFLDVGQGALELAVSSAVTVKVYQATASGDMTEVPVSNLTYQPNADYYTHIATPSKVGKVVVVVTPFGKAWKDRSGFSFHRFYGPTPPPDTANNSGGGGKG